MRDRLIELLTDAEDLPICQTFDGFADYLLANGVIVPPCKVGDTVYCIRYDKARKPFVKPLAVLSITAYGKCRFAVFTTKYDTWGITAFATAGQAEKALERNKENG